MSIRDTIDESIKDFTWNSDDEPTVIKLDTYSYALLIEELGISPEVPLNRYSGLIIQVDPEIEYDLCQIV